mgnify:CR=1 FL=1
MAAQNPGVEEKNTKKKTVGREIVFGVALELQKPAKRGVWLPIRAPAIDLLVRVATELFA